MAETLNQPQTDLEFLAHALDDFNKAMELRTERNIRVAKRVTVILRTGMLSIVLLSALMSAMMWSFTDRVRLINDVIGTMRFEFRDMSDNMTAMRTTLGQIESDMMAFSVVTNEMHATRDSVCKMSTNVQDMSTKIATMNNDIDRMATDVARMNQSFRLLAPSVSRIGASVDQGATPAKTFNNMFPMPWMMQ